MVDDRLSSDDPDEPAPTELSAPQENLADQIGPYRLLQTIGEGGMGEVYLAEQQRPLRRKVALKIIKQGMDTKEVIARFEAERQALAMMDHPAIASVHDAGTTPHGRPYFVMEFVPGVPITEYCDKNRLNIRERLELFIQVCEGVQHAHQKAIIHRDLKPSNILVTIQDEKPMPKIIDFGVAKATSSRLTERTMFTELGQLIGTPEYMSPEQAEMTGQNIDTRTDVYSLGVLLYEMLSGSIPFGSDDLRTSGILEFRRKIREDDPPKSSIRYKSLIGHRKAIAQSRRTQPERLAKNLKGDLDWITMKALEKDQSRRYETANALAMDVRRHLKDEPVLAGPPSKIYRTKKFIRRHKTGVAAAAVVSVAVILGILGTTIGMVRAMRAERVASEEAETALQVSDFLVGLFEVSDPDQARGHTITAREILNTGAEKVRGELADQPATQARMMSTIGKVYMNLGLYDEALFHLEQALSTRRIVLGEDHIDVATTLTDLAHLYIDQAKYAEAEPLLQHAATIWEAEAGPNSLELANCLTNLASAYRRQGKYTEAEPLYERSLQIRQKALGPNNPDVARSLNSLAILNWNQGNFAAAESLYQRSLQTWEMSLGSDHPDVARGLNNLALLYHHQKRYDEAEPLYKRAARLYEQVLGPEHPRLTLALNNLALLYQEQERYAEAEPLYRQALTIREKVLGADHPDVAQTLNNLANLSREQGDYATAEPLYRRALAIREEALGPQHPDVAWSLRDLGKLYTATGAYTSAEPAFQRAITIFETSLGQEHPDLADILDDYAILLQDMDRTDEAATVAARAEAIRAQSTSDDSH